MSKVKTESEVGGYDVEITVTLPSGMTEPTIIPGGVRSSDPFADGTPGWMTLKSGRNVVFPQFSVRIVRNQ